MHGTGFPRGYHGIFGTMLSTVIIRGDKVGQGQRVAPVVLREDHHPSSHSKPINLNSILHDK